MRFLLLALVLLLVAKCSDGSDQKSTVDKTVKDDNGAGGDVRHWGYRNQDRSLLPRNWHRHHPKCYGTRQSPIDIELSKSILDNRLTDIVRTTKHKKKHDRDDKKEDFNSKQLWKLKNNGHSGT